jgi:ArsR family transcriptional regulator, lead/cadmium/zinc/bismuth-responsive transcriptional repressor
MPRTPKDPFPHLAGDLLTDARASDLAELFKVLANDNRLRILHAIHLAGQISPSDIAESVGASQQAVSNQLQRLADQRIVHARRDGQRVLYRIIDPCVPGLMDLGVCLLSERARQGAVP